MAHSNDGFANSVKFVGDAADVFPKLQRHFGTSKGSLTKALTAMEKQAASFDSLGEEEELLTSQRYARNFMEAVERVDMKKSEVEKACESLVRM